MRIDVFSSKTVAPNVSVSRTIDTDREVFERTSLPRLEPQLLTDGQSVLRCFCNARLSCRRQGVSSLPSFNCHKKHKKAQKLIRFSLFVFSFRVSLCFLWLLIFLDDKCVKCLLTEARSICK